MTQRTWLISFISCLFGAVLAHPSTYTQLFQFSPQLGQHPTERVPDFRHQAQSHDSALEAQVFYGEKALDTDSYLLRGEPNSSSVEILTGGKLSILEEEEIKPAHKKEVLRKISSSNKDHQEPLEIEPIESER